MELKLPQPVAAYLAADRANDIDALRECFAADAHVHDEEHDYHGLEAIVAWKRDAQEKYQYTAEPLEASVSGQTVNLRARLTGNFPGSPVELDYRFQIEDEKIKEMRID